MKSKQLRRNYAKDSKAFKNRDKSPERHDAHHGRRQNETGLQALQVGRDPAVRALAKRS